MKTLIIISVLSAIAAISCQKKPIDNSAVPPYIISFELHSVPNEFVSVYYVDSISGKNTSVQIRPWIIDYSLKYVYADSIPTGDFTSQYLFDACEKGIKNFKLKFTKGNVNELHDLYIDFKWLPPPGGFEIPDAAIDGKNLMALPPSDSNGAGHYDTGFIYDRN